MSMLSSRRSPARQPSTPAAQTAAAPDASAQATMGNAFAQEQMAQEQGANQGPFGGDWLNDALASCFGTSLAGLTADVGQDQENADIGADAHTQGSAMSFDSSIGEDPEDLDAMEVIAHETAHALAGGGSGETLLDEAGDQGEASADAAGKEFRRWAEAGFEGPAPSLKPAEGGKAAVHRHSVNGSLYLRRGSRGSAVSTLQSLLRNRGYRIAVDGIFGGGTDSAVRSFQASRGLAADGIVGPNTAAALNGGGSSQQSGGGGGGGGGSRESEGAGGGLTGKPTLQIGSRGALVKTLQNLLNGKGAKLVVDGDFGAKTDAAVRSFQRANGLSVDGVVGPNTAGKLNSGSSNRIPAGGGGGNTSGGGNTGGGGGGSATNVDEWRNKVLREAESHLGARYYWGADGPSMFDCSGFVLYVLRQDTGLVNWGDDTAHGIKGRLPATGSPKKGDLIFYSSGGSVGHVEMYTGRGTTEIGASGGGSKTFGNDPNAKVQYGNMTADRRTRSYGSIEGLIRAKLGRS